MSNSNQNKTDYIYKDSRIKLLGLGDDIIKIEVTEGSAYNTVYVNDKRIGLLPLGWKYDDVKDLIEFCKVFPCIPIKCDLNKNKE